MYTVTISRVRPNTNVAFMTTKTDADQNYYANTYQDIARPATITYSSDTLTQNVTLTSNLQVTLTNYVAEFANTSSPLYDRTQWAINNNINVSFSAITTV